jgi:hypothetical protein
MPGPVASLALSQGIPMAMGLASQYFGKDDRKRAQQQAEEQQAQQKMIASFSPRAAANMAQQPVQYKPTGIAGFLNDPITQKLVRGVAEDKLFENGKFKNPFGP